MSFIIDRPSSPIPYSGGLNTGLGISTTLFPSPRSTFFPHPEYDVV